MDKYMYFLLILFFASFFGIVFMIGRKLSLLKNGQIIMKSEVVLGTPDIEKIKNLILKNLRKYGHMSLVEIIRFYVKTINFSKEKYEILKTKIKNKNMKKDSNGNGVEKVEVSKFLKMISEYKHKIRELKNKIHEEENNS